MEIEFRATTDPPGVEITDPIEQRHLRIETPDTLDLGVTATDEFRFPVQSAVSFETTTLRFDQLESVAVHEENGESVWSFDSAGEIEIEDAATYEIGVGSSIKLYIRVDGPFTVTKGLDNFEIRCGDVRRIAVGGRSLHEKPAATIRTPGDPRSLARAVSLFSSALKTTSPERSFPTLRGHPPLVELGDSFEVPEQVTPTTSDVTIEVPESHRHVLTVAPLSYYLAADVQFGAEPRLVTDDGFALDLGTGKTFENTVAQTLKQHFLLDCIVRTEGLFATDLHERRMLEPALPFDLRETYECSIGERLRRYSQVPYDVVEPQVPRWPLTAHVREDPEAVTFLPFVVEDMGVVRKATGNVVTRTPATRDADPTGVDASTLADAAADANATGPSDGVDPLELTFVEPDHTDESLEHAWFGDHIPQGASMPTMAAFENQLDRRERGGSTDIAVICNDPNMIDEQQSLENAYGDRKELPYDVTTRFGLSTDALGEFLVEAEVDFLHYIGHAERDGLRCIDGKLDVRELDDVSVQTFLLNACQSHTQAMAMVERGSFGGVGTLGDVVNDRAIDIGKMFAHLLNLGFPLRSALDIVSEASTVGQQYVVVGDGSVDIVQSTGGNPLVCEIDGESRLDREVSVTVYPTNYMRLGSQTVPTLSTVGDSYVVPTTTDTYTVPYDELREYVAWMTYPVKLNGKWDWNDQFGVANLDSE